MGYQDLIVYQKAKLLTKEVIKIFEMLPKTRPVDIIQHQLIRSASSIGANIAEGYGRNNPREYKQFLSISRGSSFETGYWLEILGESFASQQQDKVDELSSINTEILKMLTVTIKNLRATL